MKKSLVEMAAEIVKGMAGVARMSGQEISDALMKAYDSLKKMQKEEEITAEQALAPGGEAALKPEASIQRNKIICLECGKDFKQLSKRHLASHGLTPKEYKKKHGFEVSQALTARSLSAKRRKAARERGLGKKLGAGRTKGFKNQTTA